MASLTEMFFGAPKLQRKHDQNAMEIRTINDILDYIELLSAARAKGPTMPNEKLSKN